MVTIILKRLLLVTIITGAPLIGATAGNRVGNGNSIEPVEIQKPNTCDNRVGNGSPRA